MNSRKLENETRNRIPLPTAALFLGILLSGAMLSSHAISEVFDHQWLYEEDAGAAFGSKPQSGYTYGWSGDNASNVYDRNSKNALDDRYDRGVIMGDKFWEVSVKNGTYNVLVVAGEPDFTDAVYRINVEGMLAVDGTPRAEFPFVSGMVTVNVTDGRITVSSAPGAKNNRLAYVHITSPLHGVFPTPAFAKPPLRIDVGNLGGFPFVDEPGYVHDKMWIDNSDFGYYSPTGRMEKTATSLTFSMHSLNPVYSTYLSGTFGYKIRVSNGKYRLVLKFAEFRTKNTGRDNTHILVNGDTLIRSLDVVKKSGGQSKAFDTTLAVNVTANMIDVGFHYCGDWYSPILNGIELLPFDVSATDRAESTRFSFVASKRALSFRPAASGDRLQITDLGGRSVMGLPLSRGQTRCSIPALRHGVYIMHYLNSGGKALVKAQIMELR